MSIQDEPSQFIPTELYTTHKRRFHSLGPVNDTETQNEIFAPLPPPQKKKKVCEEWRHKVRHKYHLHTLKWVENLRAQSVLTHVFSKFMYERTPFLKDISI